MKRFPFLLALLLPSLLNTGCEKENTCGPDEMVNLTSQALTNVYERNTSKSTGTQTFVVNSQAELEKLGNYATHIQKVDFTQYTLLCGVTTAPGGVSVHDQRFQRDCNDRYVYSTRISPGVVTAPTSCFFGLLVDKLPSKTDVKFNLQEVN